MKRARTLFPRLALLLSCALQAAPAQADLYVVVHAANPVRAFTQKELVDLYMGRSRVFAHGEPALPFDLARDSLLRERFYRGLTGLPLAQVNSYWSRLMFTGQTLPPATLSTEAEMAGAGSLLAALREPVKLVDGRTTQVGASIGIAMAPRHGATLQALSEAADAAMYEVKRTGKNSFATAWLPR